MKIWPWILPLSLACTPAFAEWTFVDTGGGYERYLDRERIERKGHLVRVWEVDNSAIADADGVMSLRSQTEYDCRSRRYRIVHLSAHTGAMTEGEQLFSRPVDGEWRPVVPESLGEVSLDVACTE